MMTTRAGRATRTPTTMTTCGFSPCPSSVDDDSVIERPPPPPLSRTVTVECVELTADVTANGDDMTTSSDVIDRTNGSEIIAVAGDVIAFDDAEVDDVNTKAKAL